MYIDTKQILSDMKFYEGYSRFIENENRYETWDESVDRVMNMHTDYFTSLGKMTPELGKRIAKASVAYKNKVFLGAQRALQFGGPQLLKNQAKLYNCVSSYADRPAFFGEAFYLALCGCGVGFSVQYCHVDKLPIIISRPKTAKVHVIEDSIQGWASSLDVMMASFFKNGGKHSQYAGHKIYFDYSQIRKKGELISGGFKAPGPEPLQKALNKIENMLIAIGEQKRKMKPIEVYDIIMHMADAVISGGVRRSATICLFSPEDEEMASAKTGNWFIDNPQRGRSNNSAVLVRDKVTKEQFDDLMTKVKSFGEPGFYFTEHEDITTNPCVTSDTLINTKDGIKRVDQLLNQSFIAMVNGKEYQSNGFIPTGIKDVFKISTAKGYELKATENHKILINNGNEEEWIEVKDLVMGDKIVINKNNTYKANINNSFKHGWLLGSIIGDGGYNPEKYPSYVRFWGENADILSLKAKQYLNDLTGNDNKIMEYNDIRTLQSVELNKLVEKYITPYDKNINDSLFEENDDFLAGVIQGYFDADGTVFGSPKGNGIAVRLTSNNYNRLQKIQILLNRFDIVASMYSRYDERETLMPDGKGGKKVYTTKKTYDLHFSKESVDNFIELCNFSDPTKKEKLLSLQNMKTRKSYKNNYTTEVTSIDYYSHEIVYDCEVNDVHRFEANGLTIHNCVEIGMYPQDEEYNSGWQGCNLVEINGSLCSTEEEFLYACEQAAFIGTLQAAYTNFNFLDEVSKKIFDREALLGVSITGWMNNPEVLFDEAILAKGVEIIRKVNEETAELIGINPAARLTCTKPSGNASVLLKTASGIHGEHSPLYIRHVQINKESNVAKAIFANFNDVIEESVWSTNKTDYVVSFPCVSKESSIYKNSLIGVKQLEYVKKAQQFWVDKGTNLEYSVNKDVRHNISNTIQVDDWDEVAEYIWDNRHIFAGVSLLGLSGDKDYAQAPFTEVLTEDKILDTYGVASMFASGLIVDSIHAYGNLWIACNYVGNDAQIQENDTNNALKNDWVRRFIKFAENYYAGDLKKAEYCLKDVHNLHKWMKLQKTFSKNLTINWNDYLVETLVDIDTTGSSACVGNQCEI